MRLDHVVILSSGNPAYNVTYIETMVLDDNLGELDQTSKYFRPFWWWLPVLSVAGNLVYEVRYVERMNFTEDKQLEGHLSVRRERFGFTEIITGSVVEQNPGVYTEIVTFKETFQVSVSGDYTINETISFREHLFGWTGAVSDPIQYQVTTTNTSNPITPVPVTSYSGDFILEYDALTVELPQPILGDSQAQQIIRVNRQSRGLTRHVFKDAEWYDAIQWDYRFTNLTLAKKDAFLELVTVALGDFVTVTDHLGRERQMLIVDSYEIEEVHNDQCSYSVGALFQEIV